MTDWRAPSARRVRAIRDRLRLVYGTPSATPHGDPIAELVLTVLSQSTNDRNRDVAYLRLRERFSDWRAVRDAPVDELEEAIRPGGISKVKSARIKSILEAISSTSQPDESDAAHSSEAGCRAGARSERRLSLAWLASQPVPEAQRSLCSLPGVG
ncbi:MAG: endonuclease III domain-containing protein, partial [Solirubrobacteraceae bacterium]